MTEEFQPNEEQMKARAKQLLDMSTADLDPATVHRLQRARRNALERKSAGHWRIIFAGGLALAVVVAFTAIFKTTEPLPDHHVAAPLVEDIDLLLSAENVELADDLDFYHWLADVDTTG